MTKRISSKKKLINTKVIPTLFLLLPIIILGIMVISHQTSVPGELSDRAQKILEEMPLLERKTNLCIEEGASGLAFTPKEYGDGSKLMGGYDTLFARVTNVAGSSIRSDLVYCIVDKMGLLSAYYDAEAVFKNDDIDRMFNYFQSGFSLDNNYAVAFSPKLTNGYNYIAIYEKQIGQFSLAWRACEAFFVDFEKGSSYSYGKITMDRSVLTVDIADDDQQGMVQCVYGMMGITKYAQGGIIEAKKHPGKRIVTDDSRYNISWVYNQPTTTLTISEK